MLLLGVIAAYLAGAVPFGYLFTRLVKGVDIRRYGSGNPGATNVYRVAGPAIGVSVLILDIAKGIAAVTVIADFILSHSAGIDPTLARLVLAVATVVGHNWTVFLQLKGGKGIATSAGVLIGLSFKIAALGLIVGFCLGVWALLVLITGFVSLGSITAALTLPVLMVLFNQPIELVTFSVLLCLFAVYRHKSNIYRMLIGEERPIFGAKED